MTKLTSIIICLLVGSICLSAENADKDMYLDSLSKVALKMDEDTAKLSVLNMLAKQHNSADSTMKYAKQGLDLALKLKDSEQEMCFLGYLSWAYYYQDECVKSCESAYKAIAIADSIGRRDKLPLYYQYVAMGYDMLNDGSRAIDNFRKALLEAEQQHDTTNMIDILFQLSNVDIEADMIDDAEECMEIVESLCNVEDDDNTEYYYLRGRISVVKFMKTHDVKDYEKACRYMAEAMKKFDQEDSNRGRSRVAESYSTVLLEYAQITKDEKEKRMLLDSCRKVVEAGLAYVSESDLTHQRLLLELQKASICIEEEKYREAEKIIEQVVEEIDIENKETNIVQSICETAIPLYEKTGDYKKLSYYQNMMLEYVAKQDNVDYISKAAAIGVQQEYEAKLRERDIASEQMRVKSEWRRGVIAACVVALVMMLLTIGMEVRTNIRRKKLNIQLDEQNQTLKEQQERIVLQNESLEHQKSIIEAQNIHLESQNKLIVNANREMVDGMNYASVLQRAAMPSETMMNSVWGSNMVIYRPLRIVSGDFYWALNVDDYRILVVADCTGHGVPGAFLSMLGISILNEVTQKLTKYEASAGKMLDEVNRIFKRSLNQNGYDGDNKDGIDMSMVVVSPDRKKMHYAGAFRPLIVIKDKKATRYDADRMSIGTSLRNGLFKDHEIDVEGGELLYMYTDGITDQFGYDSNKEIKKYSSKRLINILEDISYMPLTTQQAKLELTIDSWMAGSRGDACEQTDDMLIVGVRI
ncbi:MAG: serine/threonine-protein phosphatase [Bacteroidales bacterium]|nr:serine/threonine-protein phosphatase [Bacteroidales bacterium]